MKLISLLFQVQVPIKHFLPEMFFKIHPDKFVLYGKPGSFMVALIPQVKGESSQEITRVDNTLSLVVNDHFTEKSCGEHEEKEVEEEQEEEEEEEQEEKEEESEEEESEEEEVEEEEEEEVEEKREKVEGEEEEEEEETDMTVSGNGKGVCSDKVESSELLAIAEASIGPLVEKYGDTSPQRRVTSESTKQSREGSFVSFSQDWECEWKYETSTMLGALSSGGVASSCSANVTPSIFDPNGTASGVQTQNIVEVNGLNAAQCTPEMTNVLPGDVQRSASKVSETSRGDSGEKSVPSARKETSEEEPKVGSAAHMLQFFQEHIRSHGGEELVFALFVAYRAEYGLTRRDCWIDVEFFNSYPGVFEVDRRRHRVKLVSFSQPKPVKLFKDGCQKSDSESQRSPYGSQRDSSCYTKS